jgi:REP element-mobilizing transposase RayT
VYHLAFKTRRDKPLLRTDAAKAIVLDTLSAYRKKHGYRLLGYAVMDNHVHAVVATGPTSTIADIVRAWKGYSCRHLQRLLGLTGSIWQDRYADNAIQSLQELRTVLEYIHNNPVKAGIAAKARDYRWSSAQAYETNGSDGSLIDKQFVAGS